MIIWMTILAVAAGFSFALQGPVNTALGKHTDVLQASLICFLEGAMLSLLVVMLVGDGDLALITKASPWQLTGGFYGAVNVCVCAAAMPVLGVALTLAAVLFGQLAMGTLIDLFGLFGTNAVSVSMLRVIGILLVAAGIIFIYISSSAETEHPGSAAIGGKFLILFLLSFTAGILGAMQSPVNASLAAIIGNWEGTFVSFTTGFLGILAVMLIKNRGRFTTLRGKGSRPWMYCGGALGVIGIFLSLYTVLTLGATLQVAGSMAGQLLTGMLIDTFGLIGSPRVKVTGKRMTGILLIVLGVIAVTISEL